MFLFADLNSYFATAEQQANPNLRGKPVGVCEHSGGIILAASKEAKLLGIKTGTPTWEAKKVCPQIVLLPVDPAKIRALTSRFYRIAEDYSDNVEHVSVDEVSINLAGVCFSWEDAIAVGREIKQRIKLEMGEWITASIGIAESRLLAKIGTDLQKPDGLVLILNDKENNNGNFSGVKVFYKHELYNILQLDDVPGIGSRLKKSLQNHGINTLRELSRVPVSVLHSWYGVSGVWLHDLANFVDAWRHVDLDERQINSIGHQYALGKKGAFYDYKKVYGLFWKLAEKVTARMRKQGVVGNTVSVYFGYVYGGGGLGGGHKTHDFFDDAPSVVKVAERWLKQVDTRRGVSFLAVTVSGLTAKVNQGILFEDFRLKKELPQTIDKINERFGDFTIGYAPTAMAGGLAGDTVGFGRTRERKSWREE